MTLFREEIFHIYAPGHPVGLAGIIPFVALAYIMYGFYIIMLAGVFIFNLIFIPRYGILGAALTTLFAYFAMVAVLFAIAHKVYRVEYEFSRLGAVFVITALTIAVSVFFGSFCSDSLWMKIFINCSLMLVPPLVYWFSGFLQPVEIIRLKNILQGRL